MALHPIVPYARTAYAQGWAASDGPLTDRVRAGCVAAIELAVINADDPHILEATLHLGRLEGTWAAIYDRREKLHTGNEASLLAAWRALGLPSISDELVRAARQQAGLTAEAAVEGAAAWLRDLAVRLVHNAINLTNWRQLADTVLSALNRATAEGQVDARALLAADQARVGFDFAIAFDDAYKALEHASSLTTTAEVDAWLTRTLGDAADEVGARLSVLTRAGASYEDMVTAVEGVLDGASSRAVKTAIDLLTSRALSQGSLDLYRAEGVGYVDFLTASDGRVCPICESLEKRNPYPVGSAPLPGIHPWCRCTVAPRNPTHTAPATAGPAAAAAVASDVAQLADAGVAAEDTGLAAGIASGEVSRIPLGTSTADVSLVRFADGTEAVYKLAKDSSGIPAVVQQDAEELGAAIAQAVGLVPPQVVRASAAEVYMTRLAGEVADELSAARLAELQAGDEGIRLGLADLLMGNMDRNGGNLIVDAEGRIRPIDHGSAFQWHDEYNHPDKPPLSRDFWWRRFASDDKWLDNPLSRRDIDLLQDRLRGLRGDFERLGRLDWYANVLRRLEAIARRAHGRGVGV